MLSRLIIAILLIGTLSTSAADKPNVVIIYGDDVGYADVGAYGSKLIQTPNIDQLAKGGMVFTDGHCTAATCTPSRFSLLTGVHAFRYNARILAPNAPLLIPTDIMTMPKMFKKAGYQTAVVGKWHLGLGEKGTANDWNADIKPGPLEVGFDYSFLLPYTNDRVPCVYLEGHRVVNHDPKDPIYVGTKPDDATATVYPDGRKNPEAMTYYKNSHGHNHSVINGIGRIGTMYGGKSALWNDETMADVFVEKAEEVITKYKDKPFFLFFSSQDIHVPRTPHPRFHGKTKLGYRGDAMVQLDWSTGAVMDILEKHGLTDNTIIIFSSDNGPVYDDGYQDGTVVKTSKEEVDQGHDGSGPYRGGKYQIYEGGTRVPFIIRWPARITPGRSEALVNQVDLLASFAELLNVTLAEDEAIDSRSTLNTFIGKSTEGLPYMIEEARGLALRQGNWKLIEKPTRKGGKNAPKNHMAGVELYDLSTDVAESRNVAAQHPERVKSMIDLLETLKAEKGIRATAANL